MTQPINNPPKRRVIFDTCTILHAIAQDRDEPDNNSKLDCNSRSQEKVPTPKKLRGELIAQLKTHELVIPAIVVRELEGKLQDKGLSETNKTNLKAILTECFGNETPVLPTRADLEEQSRTFFEIEYQTTKGSQPGFFKPKWDRKFKEHFEDIKLAVTASPDSGPLPYTKIMLEREELERNREAKTRTPKEAAKFFEELTEIDKKARRYKPYLLPDFEILLCAEKANAKVVSLDKDLLILWACSKTRLAKTTPRPETQIVPAGEEAIKTLAKAIRKNFNSQRPVQTPAPEEPEP